MRIDEIDIYGDFKLNGLTGNTGQFLGMSGSQLYWLDAGASTGGVSIYGTRYVYCESVTYSATMSGQILKNAYASASSIGGLSAEDRAVVLISPGVYDFLNSPLNITDSYIDLVGINSSADSVRLKASNANYVIEMIGGSIDMGLYNLSIGTASLFNVNGAGADYQRWGNVINYGSMFMRENLSSSINGINGEFRNIKVKNQYPWWGPAFAVRAGNINGIFDDIEISAPSSFLTTVSGDIYGTYSNIRVTSSGGIFQAFNMNAYFKNIKLANVGQPFFVSYTLGSYFEDIEINGDCTTAFTGQNIDGTFKNIKIETSSQGAFLAPSLGSNISGTFSNIEIGNATNLFSSSGTVSGHFENIVTGTVSEGAFKIETGSITGTYENIKVGVNGTNDSAPGGGVFVVTSSGDINGTFKNIEVGDGTTNVSVFNCESDIIGTFSNIKMGSIGQSFYGQNGDVNGYFEDIEMDETLTSFYCLGNMVGTFKNLIIGTATSVFTPEGNLIGTFSNIEIGNSPAGVMYNISNIDANIDGLTLNSTVNDFLLVGSSISGNFQNIKLNGLQNSAFNTISGNLTGTFKKIDLGALNGGAYVGFGFFYAAGGAIQGTFEDIEMDASGGINDIFYALAEIDGIFKNINTKTFGVGGLITQTINTFLTSGDYIAGTFSNISAGGIGTAITDNLATNGNFTDLKINAGTIFTIGGSGSPIIKNSILYGRVGLKTGKLLDSTVDYNHGIGSSARAVVIQNGATIERCKLLCNASADSVYSGSAVNAKISRTIANSAFSGNVTNLISTPNNIIDASIL